MRDIQETRLPGVGVRLTDHVEVGATANFLAGLGGGIQAGEGATRALEARVDEKVPSIARVIAGATWSPLEQLRVGAVFRQRFEVPFATAAEIETIDIDPALVSSAGCQLTDVHVRLAARERPEHALRRLG